MLAKDSWGEKLKISQDHKIYSVQSVSSPILTFGAEAWILTKMMRQKLVDLEKMILRKIYGRIEESSGGYVTTSNWEGLYPEVDVVK